MAVTLVLTGATIALGGPAGAISGAEAAPALSIQSPEQGVVTNETRPLIAGESSDGADPVSLSLYSGGSLVATEAAQPEELSGAWSARFPSSLPDGSYRVVAQQTEGLTGEGASAESSFTVFTAKPSVTLEAVASPTNDVTPSFSGTASEATPITVRILRGGSVFAEAHAAGTGGSWSSEAAQPALADGSYTAVAEQASAYGNGSGFSQERSFTVNTAPPHVSLNGLASPSGDSTPSFSGDASDTTPVSIMIYAGARASGSVVASASAAGTGAGWSSGDASPPLASGEYTAVAVQESSLAGNPAGVSNEVSFLVDTSSPTVTLNPVPTPSNVRSPTFAGTASDTTPVVVHVLLGGKEVDVVQATPSGGKWKTGAVKPELAAGEHAYAAYATQASSLGNPPGRSGEIAFLVNTNPPAVTIEPIATPSNDRTPSFAGTTSESTEVKVRVTGKTGKKYETQAVPSGGRWSTAALTLPNEKAEYTAVAVQASSIGNPSGESKPIRFLVDPGAPSIAMTPPRAQVNTSTPSFSGTAGDTTPVTVAVCRALSPCAAEAGEWTARSSTGGSWTAKLTTPLQDGEYQAIASQKSLLGDVGATGRVLFTVDTKPPSTTISAPANGATQTGGTVLVSGSGGTEAHDLATVTVELFAGAAIAEGAAPLQTVAVPVAAGAWSATLGGLSPGTYTLRALQSDEAGNVGTSAATSFTELSGGPAAHGPDAGFDSYPAKPHVGETISLLSTSTDASSPITTYSWNLRGSAFAPGTPKQTVSFATPGKHAVELRVSDANGLSDVASQLIEVSYPLMQPFPVVRIAGTRSGGLVRLHVLTVRAPRGATVSVACSGGGCPTRSQTLVVPRAKSTAVLAPVLAFPRFERALPAGVALTIRISHPGQIGKYTRFAVRKGKLPVRTDACLSSTEVKPVPCTS